MKEHRSPGNKVLVGLSLFLLVAGSRCAGLPRQEERAASLFSRLADRSWIASEPARTVGPADLYEEIDGEAELFLPYGFRELTAWYLHPAGDEKAEVRLEIFLHATRRDAFGIFSRHRFPGQEKVRLGASEAIVSATSLDFFQGTRFVRIRTSSWSTMREDLEKLGRDVSDLLPGTGDPPRETQVLGIPGLVDGTIVFARRALLGYEVLAPGYEAMYSAPGVTGNLVLITPEDAGPAVQFREKLSGVLPGFARLEEEMVRADLPSGTLWLRVHEGFHIGIAGRMTREKAGAVLSMLAERLSLFLEQPGSDDRKPGTHPQ